MKDATHKNGTLTVCVDEPLGYKNVQNGQCICLILWCSGVLFLWILVTLNVLICVCKCKMCVLYLSSDQLIVCPLFSVIVHFIVLR